MAGCDCILMVNQKSPKWTDVSRKNTVPLLLHHACASPQFRVPLTVTQTNEASFTVKTACFPSPGKTHLIRRQCGAAGVPCREVSMLSVCIGLSLWPICQHKSHPQLYGDSSDFQVPSPPVPPFCTNLAPYEGAWVQAF